MAIRRLVSLVVIALWLPLLTACAGGGGSVPGGCNPAVTPITQNYPSPATLTNPTTGTAWQITGVSTTLSGSTCEPTPQYDVLTVNVTFAQNVAAALPAPGTTLNQPGQLGVAIGIDSDRQFNTGTYGGCHTANLFPNEYVSDAGFQGRAGNGTYSVLSPPNAYGSSALASTQGAIFASFKSVVGNQGLRLSQYAW